MHLRNAMAPMPVAPMILPAGAPISVPASDLPPCRAPREGSRSILPICGDVGNDSLGKSHFLNFTRHRAQINQQTIHFRHPYERIAANEAGKRPLRVKRPGPKGLLDGTRLGVDGALPDSECGAEICRCHVENAHLRSAARSRMGSLAFRARPMCPVVFE